jgi:hypothetical protein
MKSAVLVIAFNRPDLLSECLASIPQDGRKIYISIDGARYPEENRIVSDSLSIAAGYKESIGEDLVLIRSTDFNQGCKYGVFNAIDWAFEFEDTLIILEDDIKPISQFFEFCDLGLKMYKHDKVIWQLNGWTPIETSEGMVNFYQTIHAHIWGWATWKNRWKRFDIEMKGWKPEKLSDFPVFENSHLHRNFDLYWNRILKACFDGEIDTWDSQWLYSMWINNSYAVSPTKRLCGNIGFDARATHTPTSGGELFSRLPDPISQVNETNLRNLDKTLQYDKTHDAACYKLDEITNVCSPRRIHKFLYSVMLRFFKG